NRGIARRRAALAPGRSVARLARSGRERTAGFFARFDPAARLRSGWDGRQGRRVRPAESSTRAGRKDRVREALGDYISRPGRLARYDHLSELRYRRSLEGSKVAGA